MDKPQSSHCSLQTIITRNWLLTINCTTDFFFFSLFIFENTDLSQDKESNKEVFCHLDTVDLYLSSLMMRKQNRTKAILSALGLALLDRGWLLPTIGDGSLERALHAGHRRPAVHVARIRIGTAMLRRGDMRFSSVSTVTIVRMMHRGPVLRGHRVGRMCAAPVTTGVTIAAKMNITMKTFFFTIWEYH